MIFRVPSNTNHFITVNYFSYQQPQFTALHLCHGTGQADTAEPTVTALPAQGVTRAHTRVPSSPCWATQQPGGPRGWRETSAHTGLKPLSVRKAHFEHGNQKSEDLQAYPASSVSHIYAIFPL